MDSSLGILADGKVLIRRKMQEYLSKLVGGIIIEVDGLSEAALQSWVGIDKVVHLISITSHNTDELSAVVFQTLKQCVDSLSTKCITIARFQSVSLVYEQHTTQSLIYQLVCLDSRLTRESRNKFRAIGLNELSSGHNTQRLENIGHDTGNGCFTCSRITGKHVVLALERIGFATGNLQVEESSKVRNFFLYT